MGQLTIRKQMLYVMHPINGHNTSDYGMVAIQFQEPACLNVVASARISDLLLNKPEGLHIDKLATLSGVDAGKLGRVLRLLATKHIYQEGKLFVLHG
jgi:hypothetical protein